MYWLVREKNSGEIFLEEFKTKPEAEKYIRTLEQADKKEEEKNCRGFRKSKDKKSYEILLRCFDGQ